MAHVDDRRDQERGAVAARQVPSTSTSTETAMSPLIRALVGQLVAALAPIRQRTDAFPFAIASDEASFTIAVTKAQIIAVNAAIDAADQALASAMSDRRTGSPADLVESRR